MGSLMATREELRAANVDPVAYVGLDRDWYDGSVRGMDEEIGRLAERLRQLGLDRKVLLVLTGDHGEEFLDHGRMFHGQSVYGEMNNMPLILWGPGRVREGAVDETVETIDVMPTLLEASGLPVPEEAQGRSLWPLVTGTANAGTVRAEGRFTARPAISEKNVTTVAAGAPPPRDTESFAVVLGGFKLIHNTKHAAGRPEYELFDHRGDPGDRKDVAAEHPDVVGRLSRELEAWHRKAQAARLKPDAAGEGMSSEELERLRALGYIQ
jgi:arylsulfatase